MNKISIILAYIFLLTATNLFADSPGADNSSPQPVNKVNNASTSKRVLNPDLPPLLPGEEVNLNGRKTKVWSTSGTLTTNGSVPVPNSPPGSDWTLNGGNPNNVDVIIDGRDLVPYPQRDRPDFHGPNYHKPGPRR